LLAGRLGSPPGHVSAPAEGGEFGEALANLRQVLVEDFRDPVRLPLQLLELALVPALSVALGELRADLLERGSDEPDERCRHGVLGVQTEAARGVVGRELVALGLEGRAFHLSEEVGAEVLLLDPSALDGHEGAGGGRDRRSEEPFVEGRAGDHDGELDVSDEPPLLRARVEHVLLDRLRSPWLAPVTVDHHDGVGPAEEGELSLDVPHHLFLWDARQEEAADGHDRAVRLVRRHVALQPPDRDLAPAGALHIPSLELHDVALTVPDRADVEALGDAERGRLAGAELPAASLPLLAVRILAMHREEPLEALDVHPAPVVCDCDLPSLAIDPHKDLSTHAGVDVLDAVDDVLPDRGLRAAEELRGLEQITCDVRSNLQSFSHASPLLGPSAARASASPSRGTGDELSHVPDEGADRRIVGEEIDHPLHLQVDVAAGRRGVGPEDSLRLMGLDCESGLPEAPRHEALDPATLEGSLPGLDA